MIYSTLLYLTNTAKNNKILVSNKILFRDENKMGNKKEIYVLIN